MICVFILFLFVVLVFVFMLLMVIGNFEVGKIKVVVCFVCYGVDGNVVDL